jgi:hypothetical protein
MTFKCILNEIIRKGLNTNTDFSILEVFYLIIAEQATLAPEFPAG